MVVPDEMDQQAFTLPFFVYGTLLPGQPNFGLWQHAIVRCQPAALHGAFLFDHGFYPMMIEGMNGGQVNGLVVYVQSRLYGSVLRDLDYLEGYDPAQHGMNDFSRVKRVVRLITGQKAVAWVYVGRKELVDGLPPIGDDWKRYAESRQQSLDYWWATIASVRDRSHET
jgi:gamma-glutamylcyclotransferase (GGCT)/AIG2-like uncharacterized protein YtfP